MCCLDIVKYWYLGNTKTNLSATCIKPTMLLNCCILSRHNTYMLVSHQMLVHRMKSRSVLHSIRRHVDGRYKNHRRTVIFFSRPKTRQWRLPHTTRSEKATSNMLLIASKGELCVCFDNVNTNRIVSFLWNGLITSQSKNRISFGIQSKYFASKCLHAPLVWLVTCLFVECRN